MRYVYSQTSKDGDEPLIPMLNIYKCDFCCASLEQIYVYHKAFPMPVLSYKFENIDPVSGLEVEDASQFISSVCWRGQSSTLVAANSTGNIKILEMV